MSRVLLAFVFVAALSATTLAANVHFAVGAADPATAISLPQGTGPTAVDLHCDTEGVQVFGGTVDITASTTSLPASAVFGAAWAGFSAYNGAGLFSLFSLTGDGPSAHALLASFSLDTENWAPGVYTLTAAGGPTGTVMTDAVGGPLQTSTTDLVITITPEPATLGLLVLGGLAVLRRRFA